MHAASRPVSGRVLLARLAEQTIAGSDGVSAAEDLRWSTPDGDHRIAGVLAAADGGGRVDVELRVVIDWPPRPLEQVAADLRQALTRRAAIAQLDDRLGKVQIRIHDIRGTPR